MKKILYLLIVLMLVVSCGTAKDNADEYALSSEMIAIGYDADFNASEPSSESIVPQLEKKIIKTGRLGIEVRDIKSAKDKTDLLVGKFGGYYSSERFDESDYTASYTLSIRISAKNYEDFIAGLESDNGKVLYKEIKANDITEQFLDVETRLENKRIYLQRYRELLKKASTIKDILEIEKYIRELEEEMESAEGKLRYMGDQVSYSTLTLTLQQDKDRLSAPGEFWRRLGRSFSGGWEILKDVVLGILWLWPLWIIGGVIYIWVLVRNNRKRDKSRK